MLERSASGFHNKYFSSTTRIFGRLGYNLAVVTFGAFYCTIALIPEIAYARPLRRTTGDTQVI
jgi:hypothetical protein